MLKFATYKEGEMISRTAGVGFDRTAVVSLDRTAVVGLDRTAVVGLVTNNHRYLRRILTNV
jgi:hypothetical protein